MTTTTKKLLRLGDTNINYTNNNKHIGTFIFEPPSTVHVHYTKYLTMDDGSQTFETENTIDIHDCFTLDDDGMTLRHTTRPEDLTADV